MYSPTLGRFMQTDPIGFADGSNLYDYVGSDPVNNRDPAGLFQQPAGVAHNGCVGQPNGADANCYPGPDIKVVFNTSPATWAPAVWIDLVGGIRGGGGGSGGGGISGGSTSPQIAHVAQRYNGNSFCSNPTVGRLNRFNPLGRITSGKTGGFDTALGDVDRIASANGLQPLGSVIVNFFSTFAMSQFLIPTPLGGGWTVGKSYWTGDTTISNSGLGFRYNAESGKINIDIPSGATLPNGTTLSENETCHYTR